MSAFAFSFMEFKGKKSAVLLTLSNNHDDPAGCTDCHTFTHSKPFIIGEHIYGIGVWFILCLWLISLCCGSAFSGFSKSLVHEVAAIDGRGIGGFLLQYPDA